MNAQHDLVFVSLWAVILAIGLSAILLQRVNSDVDIETRKIRFAAATFTGMLMLFIFTAILYYTDPSDTGRGKEIFEKAFTGMSPLAGAIVGYLFGSKSSSNNNSSQPTSTTRDEESSV